MGVHLKMEDWWLIVFENLHSSIDFRELGLTCKRAYIKLQLFKYKLKNSRHFERLMRMFPDKDWDSDELWSNPGLTWEIVETAISKYLSLEDNTLHWYRISQNPCITWEIICSNPDLPWDWNGISQNPCLTWEIISKNPQHSWSWGSLSLHPNVT